MNNSQDIEVLCHGRWPYGDVDGHLWIVRQTWDHFHEEFSDDGPSLSTDGWAYYVLYGVDASVESHLSRSRTCLSKPEAIELAADTCDSITWDS